MVTIQNMEDAVLLFSHLFNLHHFPEFLKNEEKKRICMQNGREVKTVDITLIKSPGDNYSAYVFKSITPYTGLQPFQFSKHAFVVDNEAIKNYDLNKCFITIEYVDEQPKHQGCGPFHIITESELDFLKQQLL